MHAQADNTAFRGINAAAMQESPRHSWADRDGSSYRYIPAPPGIKHPFAQPRYNDGARTTPSRSHQSHNHNTWTQKSDNYRHQSNPRPSQHRGDDDASSQSSYNNRPRSNMRHPSAQRRQQQPNTHNHHENHRAVSADRRRSFTESPMRGGEYNQRQSYSNQNGSTNRHHTPHRQGWRQENHSHHRPGPPQNRGPPNPHSTWSNYAAPIRNPDPPTLPTAPPSQTAPPAPASDAASEVDADDQRGNGPVKLPSTFEITDDLKKKYHMLESADGKIILLRKTPRGKRGGVKHRKNKLETVESLPSSDAQGTANETKSEDSDHSSSDVITVPGNGQRHPPPPPPRQPNSPKRVQSIVSALNRQLSHTSSPINSPTSPSHPSSPSASPNAASEPPHSAEPPSPSAPDTPSAASEAEPPPSTASSEDAAAKREAAKKKRLEELVREINDLRFAKQRAEEAQEQLSIQTQSLLQEKSSLLQRVGEREKQIANLQERLEYVEQECEDLRQGSILDPQLLSVLSDGTLNGLDQLLPESQGSLMAFGTGSHSDSHDALGYTGSGDL